MNLWEWVTRTVNDLDESGHEALARHMWNVPDEALDGHTDRAVAMATDVVTQARALHLPWVEVYARHWRLQSQDEGAATLPEAVDLFEFAHRDETRDCPQSVCATQDLTLAYGGTDGCGYAAERAAVAQETLARIDPSWGCFHCLSVEWARAVLEGGDPDGAVALLERQIATTLDAGEDVDESFRCSLALLLVDAGRPADALAILDELGDPADDPRTPPPAS